MSAALISIGVNDYLLMASGGEIRELKDRKCQHDYSCRSSTGMCDKINFMAVSCQNTGLFHLWSFMGHYAKTDYFLCVPRTSWNLFHRGNKTDYLCAFMNW